ncbi:MAG: hypothetical protein ISS28_08740 [Candidatus Cloacimonetes bacterium]|nr:hypothetical protein [Candidatus Cloacimonadota bacterium]
MKEVKFDTQKIVNKFEKLFKICSEHIGYLNGNIDMSLNKQIVFNLENYIKNINTLDKLKALRSKFYSLIFFCEYFTKKVEIKYSGKYEMKEEFIDSIFTSQLTDGFRSILDIFSIFTLSFFNKNETKEINFSWKGFIKPIKNYSIPIYEFSNNIYKKYNKSTTKEIRDRDKHLGFNQISVKPVIIDGVTISSTFTKKEYPKLFQVISETSELIEDFTSLFEITIKELYNTEV